MLLPPSVVAGALAATAVGALIALWAALSRKGRTEDEARAYLAGVRYVLSDDPDAAIAELSKAAQLNRQTLETYFALGTLFRRKGELDRAIRLHTNMLLRAGLGADVRRRALLALAVDYKLSGLRDKASETFERLLSEEPDHREGLLCYRQLCEEAGQWARAIALQSRWVGLEGASGHPVLAHLLAAAARSALGASDVEEAEVLAERAVAVRAESPDAQLALGEVRLKQGRALQAAALLRKAVELEPELAPRAVRMLNASMGEAVEVQRFLERQISRSPQPAPFELALALHHRSCGAFDRAIALLRRLVDRHPRFWDARRELGTLLLEHDRSEEMRADYEEILGTLGQQPAAFRCGACRQNLPDHTFRCPACEGWDTIYREIDPRSLAA